MVEAEEVPCMLEGEIYHGEVHGGVMRLLGAWGGNDHSLRHGGSMQRVAAYISCTLKTVSISVGFQGKQESLHMNHLSSPSGTWGHWSSCEGHRTRDMASNSLDSLDYPWQD